MRNDRDDDKYEGSENSEYHFSDDSYEVDANAAKQQSTASDVTVEKSAKSKKTYITLGIFLVLVVVVYKMVVPSSTQPSLDITHQAANNTSATPANNSAAQTVAANQQATPSNPVIPVQSAPATQPQAAPTTQQQQQLDAMQKVLQAQQANAAVQNQMQGQPQGQPQNAAPVMASNAPTAQQAANNMQQMMNQAAQGAAQVSQQQAAVVVQPGTSTSTEGLARFDSNAPAGQSVQGPAVSNQVSSGNLPTTNAVTTNNSPVNQAIDASGAMMNNQINSASAAADAETARRMAEFQNQNKNLQDQVQLMNSRMALIESQMNQLVQTLTQQFQGSSGGLPSFNPAQSPATTQQPAQQQQIPPSSMMNPQPIPEVASAPVRLPYNVQAIIPGRAWLRSNTGDTITVAENDDIKGIGRVTKIDPYDGIVTIDVHGKPVSLSYGNSN